MKKKVIIYFTLVIFLFLITSAKAIIDDKVDGDVRDKIESDNEARVFINYSNNVFAAIIDKEDLSVLERNRNVKNIELVKERRISLRDSVPLIGGKDTHALQYNGINLTGKGQTICVIDSGVNYNHPDLGGCYGNNSLASECKIWGGRDFCSDDSNCLTEDDDPLDVIGHGTHVSGIIAADGEVKGVAPDARIIMLKACNSQGVCYDDKIKASINWCISNAKKFNISIISMSFGGDDLFSDYCNEDPLAVDINNAVNNNISVVVASGNAGSSSGISGPACVESAIPIGSILKDDSTINFNRNLLVKIVAPGVNIESTYLSGHKALSGTSMSTPHAAGAISIINQFLKQTEQNKTISEIESILEATGRKVYDSSSELDYSRIDIYNAIISLDNEVPKVGLIYPNNKSISFEKKQIFSCMAEDLALRSINFYLWGSNDTYKDISQEVNGSSHLFQTDLSDLDFGKYFWNCMYTDRAGNNAFGEYNSSWTLRGVSVNLLSENEIYTNNNKSEFSCSAETDSDSRLASISFHLWNSTGLLFKESKNVSGINNFSLFNYEFRNDGKYNWNCLALNNETKKNFAETNFSYIFDVKKPEVNLTSPDNNYTLSGTTEVLFAYSVKDNSIIDKCDLTLNGAEVLSNVIGNYSQNNFSYTLSSGNYSWSVRCNDKAGNIGNSELRNIIVNFTNLPQPDPSPVSNDNTGGNSGGGGGGGSRNRNTPIVVNPTINISLNKTAEDENNQEGEIEYLNENSSGRSFITGRAIGDSFFDRTITRFDIIILSSFALTLALAGLLMTYKNKLNGNRVSGKSTKKPINPS